MSSKKPAGQPVTQVPGSDRYQGPPGKAQRGSKNNSKTKPSAQKRLVARVAKKKEGKL